MSDRKRYVIVGTGGRCRMFIESMYGPHAAHAELVGLCDLSQTRMNYYNAEIAKEYKAAPVP
ncbi:MAG: Gfo/Idh/MocA family oxidoreductase, partial [Phycisphaerales bacterium]|nr:Gfo/Idh/MocA family oxidoreductase [Phycisphaerales bacterium]